MSNKSVKKNFFYNFSLNIFNIAFPLVTSPYVSRILGANNLGKYSFAISLSNWFLIFAAFGIPTYGIREIAKVKNNKEKLNKTFSELFILNFITTLISLIAYLFFIFIYSKTNCESNLFLVVGILVLLNVFSLDWFYIGMEEYGYIALRSLMVKLIALVCIFMFIKRREDYLVYALISVFALGFANILNFVHSRKFVRLDFKKLDLNIHKRKLAIFFVSSVIISMYTLFDQIFLGMLSTNKSVAFYSRARQIYSIGLCVTLSISNVLLPKLIYLFENDFENYKVILKKSINYIYIFSVPIVFGMMILSKDIMYFFGGKEFEKAYLALVIVSLLVFIVSLSTWQFNQLFLPFGLEKFALKAQLLIAIISFSLNIILIPKYGYIGASISIIIAECSGTLYGVFYSKAKIKEVEVIYMTKSLRQYIFSSICMTCILYVVKLLNLGYMSNILICTVLGSTIYFAILYIVKDEIVMELFNFFIIKVKKIAKENVNA